jgi:hypothetical protein
MLTLLLCAGCGGSSSETPPPLEPDPRRLVAPAPTTEEELAPVPPATSPVPGSGDVEDGAEFGIEPLGTRSPPANGGSRRQTWGASPATKTKRPPPHTP